MAILKPDHIGDLLIATRAFAILRQYFPLARIDLICGEWNVALARRLGFFDNVFGVDLFHEISRDQNDLSQARAARRAGIERLEALQLGPYDLAIDLRYDRDSRVILTSLEATVFAGFGSKREFPFLDIALPMEGGVECGGLPSQIAMGGHCFQRGGQKPPPGATDLRNQGRISADRSGIHIDFVVRGAKSPAECGTMLADTRELGIALRQIQITPVCGAGAGSDPAASSPRSLILTPNHPTLGFVHGWGQLETWGVWGLGRACRLHVELPPADGESEIRIDLDLIAHVNPANRRIDCTVRVDQGGPDIDVVFIDPDNTKSVSLVVSRHDPAVTLTSEPFGLAPGYYKGALRLYLPRPGEYRSGLWVRLRRLETGATLFSRRAMGRLLNNGLCDIPIACWIETGADAICAELLVDDAEELEGATLEMLRLECDEPLKLEIPGIHMEQRAAQLAFQVALAFSDDPLFSDEAVERRLAEPDRQEDRGPVARCVDRIAAWRAAGCCVVGIGLGCNSEIRKWPPHYYVELARQMLHHASVQVVFIGGFGDREEAETACQKLSLDPEEHSFCGDVRLHQLGEVLRPLDLFIGNNTGTIHFAGRVGVRTIGIYSGTNHPREWGPVGANVSWLFRNEKCAPCFLTELKDCRYGHTCLRNLLPGDVLPLVQPEIDMVLSRRAHTADNA